MGTGKTTLIKHGISKILNRPFAFITLGGASDGSFLEGHSFTYEGSAYGKIVDILIQSKVSNPVIFFDELDKVSQSEKGNEIIGILTHLTDTTQNSQFHDKYFSELEFDLSKCLFVFSYNDEQLVNPILKDRMFSIDIKGYDTDDKIVIARDYLIPEISKEYRMTEIGWKDDMISYVIERTEPESGVRNLKRSLETIYSKLNLERILQNGIVTLSQDKIDEWFPKLKVETYSSMYL
jgi:ATP-dependent Lon protease